MNITYLLGAGASANAVPVVERTNMRMEFFFHVLDTVIQILKSEGISDSFLESRVIQYKKLFELIKGHLSYDTYAKKLWLKGISEPAVNSEFILLKELISIFYYFEQMPSFEKKHYYRNYLNKIDPNAKEFVLNEVLNFYELQCDKRYDAFFAGIADENKKDSLFIPDNINIVSWNYDMQLELVLEEYGKNGYSYAFDPVKHDYNDILDPVQYKFIKLNGSCGYSFVFDKSHKVINRDIEIQRYFKSLNDHNLKDLVIYILGFRNRDEYGMIPYINFAWEDNKYSNIILNQAENIFSKTDGLVVIGYSFPLFNRKIDKQLFSKLKLADNSKIYIQTNSDLEYERIKSRINGLLEIKENKIEYIPDSNQFFVPFELNKETESRYSINMQGHSFNAY